MSPNVYAIIPARGGSKGVPGKNLKLLGGRPLLAHTVSAARAARCVSRILLSTDDPAIAAAGQALGAEVPLLRPAGLATDTAPVFDAIEHLLAHLTAQGETEPDYILLLQPTSPLRTAGDIEAAFDRLLSARADALISVSPAQDHPLLCKQMDAAGRLTPYFDTPLQAARRQDLPPAYVPNGAIYLIKTRLLLSARAWCPPGTMAYVMPPDRSIDLDTPEDFERAEWLLQSRRTGGAQ